jgi:DNA polymerase III subunit delta'
LNGMSVGGEAGGGARPAVPSKAAPGPARPGAAAPAPGWAPGSVLFQDVVGQDMALSVLTRALAQTASHAYIFSGPPGVGKSEAALAFAAGLACPDGGCGACGTCRRVQEGLHPDVELITPEGSRILVDQIREINSHVAYRPFEARAKVYVLFEAETMNQEAANAFLRTLEEPPPHVHFLLVTDAVEKMLPTIVSRCQQVPFSRTPTPLIESHLIKRLGVEPGDAEVFARVAQGNLEYARELASSADARERRRRLLQWAGEAAGASLWQTETALDEILQSVEQRADAQVAGMEEKRDKALEWAGDARTKAWINKQHEQRVRRERRRAVAEGLGELTRLSAGWYRDLALVSLGADQAVLNRDYLQALESEALAGRHVAYLEAVLSVRKAQERLRYNVDVRNAVSDMFRAIKEALI